MQTWSELRPRLGLRQVLGFRTPVAFTRADREMLVGEAYRTRASLDAAVFSDCAVPEGCE